MSANFHDHVVLDTWPPSSPDLNPPDYYAWGVVDQHSHNTIQSFKSAITKTLSEIDQDHLIRTCQRFRPRIEAIIEANGGFMERARYNNSQDYFYRFSFKYSFSLMCYAFFSTFLQMTSIYHPVSP